MSEESLQIKKPPTGLAIIAMIGPSLVWCGEYIGSGEVILATRTGAILGAGILWAVVIGIFLKYWIGMSGARYTVCTGEGMIDMFSRIPGPANWVVWIVLIVQFVGGTLAIGSIANISGIFINSLIPIHPNLCSWALAIIAVVLCWSGVFEVLKAVLSICVLVIVLGVLYVALHVFPSVNVLLSNLTMNVPPVPDWALAAEKISSNPWREILPLIGWGAGGFASQVWYTYWVLGAGYGAANGRSCGQRADVTKLKTLSRSTALQIKGWCRMLYFDATFAFVIGTVITCSFLIAGAGVLGPKQLAPQGEQVAFTLSKIFSLRWGAVGGVLFKLAGTAALVSTLIALFAGWPRLLSDALRLCLPTFAGKFRWKTQYRFLLLYFLFTNMIIVFTFGVQPVRLIQISAMMDGLLLTPLQALWVAAGLFVVMPKMLSPEAAEVLRPNPIFAAGLIVTALAFGYLCLFKLPLLIRP